MRVCLHAFRINRMQIANETAFSQNLFGFQWFRFRINTNILSFACVLHQLWLSILRHGRCSSPISPSPCISSKAIGDVTHFSTTIYCTSFFRTYDNWHNFMNRWCRHFSGIILCTVLLEVRVSSLCNIHRTVWLFSECCCSSYGRLLLNLVIFFAIRYSCIILLELRILSLDLILTTFIHLNSSFASQI